MRVKKLEVVGFKSFLEKLVFQFSHSVTGIVGPNGCGKSNVVDAIKWVTGELSFKQLRGRSMEDLIFAGSEMRPPTGMAEVALTLDNSDGRGPVQYKEYAEITVLRRIFRDGTSEFTINKTPCRLRDIVDLFLDTGIGQSSYSIIEQGRVGLIVSSKPDERRSIIEEAAGITKYKHRKKAAERKMEYTKQNLLRVSDVIGELKRQINSLERQAKKAEKFKQMRDRAKDLDLGLSALSFERLTEQHRDLVGLNTEQETQISSEKTEIAVLESKIENKRLHLMDSERHLESAQTQLLAETSEIAALENKIDSLERSALQLVEQAREERDRATSLAQLRDELEEKKRILHHTITNYEAERNRIDIEVNADLETESNLKEEVSSVERRMEKSKQDLMSVVTKEAELKNQWNALSKRQSQIEEELAIRTREHEKLASEHAQLEERYAEIQKAMGMVVQLRFGFEQDQKNTQIRLTNLEGERTQCEKRLNELNQKLEGRRSRLAALLEFEKTYQGYGDGVRAVMENRASDRQMVGEIVGLLGEMVHPKRGYEKALEAALSDRVGCLVVESSTDAVSAIDFLVHEKRGRGAFLPKLVRNFRKRDDDLTKSEGVVGFLKEYVDVKEEYRELFSALLSDVVLVEDIRIAIQLWERGFEWSMVTPRGEFVSRQGIIVGGEGEGDKGVFEIRREIEELEESVDAATKQRENEERTLELLVREIAANRASLEKVETALGVESKKAFDHEKDVERIQEGILRTNDRLETIEEERRRLRFEKDELSNTLLSNKEELETLDQKRVQQESILIDLTETLQQKKQALIDHQDLLTQKRILQASLREKYEASIREKDGLETQQNQTKMESENLLRSASDREERANEHRRSLQEVRDQRVELIQRHEQTRSLGQKLKSDHDLMQEEIRKDDEELKLLRESVGQMESEWNQGKMRLQEISYQINHIVEQIQERYAVSLIETIESNSFERFDEESLPRIREELNELKDKMVKMGDVHLGAIEEIRELQERFTFMSEQKEDLEKTLDSLQSAIRKINQTTKERFKNTFEEINNTFQTIFPRLFNGGKAKLILTDPENILESGVDIIAQPPGKKLQNMNLLSGGEKAMTAISLLFAIFQYKSPPFCLLDEVDAPLDDANVRRFIQVVREMSDKTQFIVITHNKATMEIADHLYGVTMEEPGVSRTVSVKLQEAVAITEANSTASTASAVA